MRRHLVSLAVAALAWSAASVLAADLTGDQRKALDGMLEFYRHMGAMGDAESTALADRLQDAIHKKSISFGEVPDNDNAIADPLTGTIVFNKSVVSEVNSSSDEAFTGKAEFGATIAHEFEHLDQYSLYVSASKAASKAGRGHPAEQAAWNKGFDRLAIWISRMKAELVRQEENRERMRERAWTANQLRFLCNAWSNYRNGYDQKKSEYGEILVVNPADPTGKRVALETALAEVESIRKEAIGIARIGDQLAIPFDGLYDGTVGAGHHGKRYIIGIAKGEIRFLIRGTNVEVNVKCTNSLLEIMQNAQVIKDKGDNWFRYKLSGSIDVDGNVRARSTEGYAVELEGNFSNGEGKGVFRPAGRGEQDWSVWEVKRL